MVNTTFPTGDAPAAVPLTMSMNRKPAAMRPSSDSNTVSADRSDHAGHLSICLRKRVGHAVPGSKNNGDGTVTANITRSGVFMSWPAPFRDQSFERLRLSRAQLKPSLGQTVITFTGLAADSTIKVYTIMGELVQTLTGVDVNGQIQWNVKNSDGKNVASGVYIYQIKNSFSEKRGKLVIIR